MEDTPNIEELSFEQSVQQLESLVQQLESGDNALTDLVSRYERGVQLLRHSQQLLEAAELKITQLDESKTE